MNDFCSDAFLFSYSHIRIKQIEYTITSKRLVWTATRAFDVFYFFDKKMFQTVNWINIQWISICSTERISLRLDRYGQLIEFSRKRKDSIHLSSRTKSISYQRERLKDITRRCCSRTFSHAFFSYTIVVSALNKKIFTMCLSADW